MQTRTTDIPGVIVIDPVVHGDARGYFLEVWHARRYGSSELPSMFVQVNLSRSAHGTIRGLHLQEPFGQGKLVHVLEGEVFDVAVDVRRGSPTFGRWLGETLSGANHRQMYLPPGVAHGFCVVSQSALVMYSCTEFYRPDTELTVAWNDPDLAVAWPQHAPQLSIRDASAPRLVEIPAERLPRMSA